MSVQRVTGYKFAAVYEVTFRQGDKTVSTFFWILTSGLLMAATALIGSVAFFLNEITLQRILTPMVAFAAGSLLGGAFFHMLPEAVVQMSNEIEVWIYLVLGFLVFFILEQFLHWHHSHRPSEKQPLTYLILFADGLHNFIGGASVGAAFLVDIRLGITAWMAAMAHEIPQELGDFAILVHGGWSKARALTFNFLSALTFPIGGLLTFLVSQDINVIPLVPFAAGNFIYIAAADLIPEIKHAKDTVGSILHLVFFLLGLGVLLGMRSIDLH